MNDKELIRKLNSVGKQAFFENFNLFQSYASGRLSRDQAIEELVRLGVSNNAGAGMRVGNAKQIFEAGKEMDALSIIINSTRLSLPVLALARSLKQ